MSPAVQKLEGGRYTAGETVKGTVLVTEGGGSRFLEARLEFVEETDDYLEVPIGEQPAWLPEGVPGRLGPEWARRAAAPPMDDGRTWEGYCINETR